MALLATAFDGHVKAIGIIAVHWSSLDNTVYEILQKPFNLMEEAEKFPGFDSGMKRLNKLKEWLQSADCPRSASTSSSGRSIVSATCTNTGTRSCTGNTESCSMKKVICLFLEAISKSTKEGRALIGGWSLHRSP